MIGSIERKIVMKFRFIITRINEDLITDQLVRNRYQRVIGELQEKGFVYYRSYSETQFPFSLLLLTQIYIMMRKQAEVIRIVSPLRVSAYYPLLLHRDTGSIALINGLNTKFYTQFTDGTLIISVNSQTKTILDVEEKVYKASFPGSETAIWEKHLDWMAEFLKAGKQVKPSVGFEDYNAMSIHEDKSTLWETLGLIAGWLCTLYIVIRMLISVWRMVAAMFF
jgi:hypothetical protein